MPDYNLSKLYKLVFPDGHYYIGSTTRPYLCQRMAVHRQACLDERHVKTPLYAHMRKVGAGSCSIDLIENCPCETKDELRHRENELIVKAKKDPLCLNHNRAIITEQDRKEWEAAYKAKEKAARNAMVTCECGLQHTVGRTTQHRLSARHFKALKATSVATAQSSSQATASLNTPPTA
jgi:hypothetical protein